MLGLTLTPISKEAPGKYAHQHFIQSKRNVNIFQNQNFQFDFDRICGFIFGALYTKTDTRNI